MSLRGTLPFFFGFDTSPSIIISSRRFVVKIPHCGRRSLAIIDFWVERGGDYFRWVTNVWIRSLDGVEKRRLTSLFTKQSAIAIVVLGGTTSFAIALRSLQRLHIGFASVSCVCVCMARIFNCDDAVSQCHVLEIFALVRDTHSRTHTKSKHTHHKYK